MNRVARVLVLLLVVAGVLAPASAAYYVMKGANPEDFRGWIAVGGSAQSVGLSSQYADDLYWGWVFGTVEKSKYSYAPVDEPVNYLAIDNPGWQYISGYIVQMKHNESGDLIFDRWDNVRAWGGTSCTPDKHGNCTISRFEMVWDGLYWNYYADGIYRTRVDEPDQMYSAGTAGTSTYIEKYGFISHFQLGAAHTSHISTIPHTFYLMKDMLDPTVTGLYDSTGNGVYVGTETKMHFRYSLSPYLEGGAGSTPGATYTVRLKSAGGTTWASIPLNPFIVSSGRYAGQVAVDVKTLLIDSNAPYGLYTYTLYVDEEPVDTDYFMYIANGAVISWDQDRYVPGDTGIVISTVAEGGYWDPAQYSYEVKIVDLYGTEKESWSVPSQSYDYEVDTTGWDAGDYFALLYAIDKITHTEYVMAFDVATLVEEVQVHGTAYNAVTTDSIPGASVFMSQGGVWYNTTTNATGYYVLEGMNSGSGIIVDGSASGYTFDSYTFTPLSSGDYQIDLYFIPEPVSSFCIGSCIGGLVYTDWNHQGVEDATVYLKDSEGSTITTDTTNLCGWYLFNDLATSTSFLVNALKGGYNPSDTYTVTTGG